MVVGTTDALHFEMAAGQGAWSAVGEIPLGIEANLNQGWNVLAGHRSHGAWHIGYGLGSAGSRPSVVEAFIEASIVSGTHTGMGWRSSLTDSEDFGFDGFVVVAPSPAAGSGGLFLLVALVLRAACRR